MKSIRNARLLRSSAAPRLLRSSAAPRLLRSSAAPRSLRPSVAPRSLRPAALKIVSGRLQKDYAANPIKLANNQIFASLTADATAHGKVLYLEAEQCNTTAALERAGVMPARFHAVTADSVDFAQICAKRPRLTVSHDEVSAVLESLRFGLCSAWLDYCSEPYGTGDRSPPRDIARAIALLARNTTQGHTTILAVTAAASRLPPGRIAAIRTTLIANGFADLAPSARDLSPIPVAPFLAEVVRRAAAASGVAASEVANVQYKSAGNTGQSMTFIAFRFASK